MTEEELKALDKQCEEFSAWLDEEEAKQNALQGNEEPVLTSSAILHKLEPIQTMVEQVLKRRKPLPPKPKKKKKVKKSEENKTDDDGSTEAPSNGDDKQEEVPETEKTEAPTESAESEGSGHDEL